jgi:hypothetical protein
MLYFDDRLKPYGWSSHKDAPLFDVPGMNNPKAIVFVLAEQYLMQILPKSSMTTISHHFNVARKVLSNADGNSNMVESWFW